MLTTSVNAKYYLILLFDIAQPMLHYVIFHYTFSLYADNFIKMNKFDSNTNFYSNK